MKFGGGRTGRSWQWQLQVAATFLFCLMITLNLRILYISKGSDVGEGNLEVVPCNEHPVIQVAGTASVQAVNASTLWGQWLALDPTHTKVLGYPRRNKGLLTVGIPSIKRVNGPTYLLQTLKSLIKMTSTVDKTRTVVMVFLADFDAEYNSKVIAEITEQFTNYISMGFIQVVQVSKSFYPPLQDLKRNFNDKPERVTWRSKQVMDFAFMFLYAHNISDYYVQLEDDVICAPNFVSHIESFIKQQKQYWAMLEFSELGFIGKLMKSSDLLKFAQFLRTFYVEQPVDWLMTLFRLSMAQKKAILRKPTLFQHVGTTSSFDTSKPNNLKDKFFIGGEQKEVADNPPAAVLSDITVYDRYSPDQAYSQGSGFFWGRDVKQGQALYIIFDRPQKIKRVQIISGSVQSPKDVLKAATLEVSDTLISMEQNKADCKDFTAVTAFLGGAVDESKLSEKFTQPVKCLRVLINADQEEWVIIPQILIYVNSS